ncbi:MAG: hypothetical protein NT001_00175, partial [Candidatus Woesearchaeota archaeon]|nr:hypothetical protein [Candidatus Woesearchaeota archaeon]
VFIVNKDAPSRPIFNVIGGVLHDGIWYVKESPQFTLFFSEPVKIWSYVKNYVDPNNFDYLSSNCVGTKDSNFFDGCTFNPSITSTPIGSTVEDVHQIVVMAGKVLNGNIYGPASPIYLDPVIIDNITPDIQSVQDLEKIRENYDKIFKVKVLNEAHDLNATLIYPPDACLSENNYPLTQVAKDGTDYYFKWEIPACNRIESKLAEGDKKISIKVADYAGNSDTYDTTTYLDLTPPKIEDINLEVMPTRTIAIGNYTTKETEIIIKGTFAEKDTDVKSVSIV